MDSELAAILDLLRINAGDTAGVEVKSAAGGLPEDLTATLCALANLPGGGRLVLGLDERNGFLPSGLRDPQAIKQAVASKGRAVEPPVTCTMRQVDVDGNAVVIAVVPECPASAKPARVRATGDAWLRRWDGDYRMSDLEVQGFLRLRGQPRADREPVEGATIADLDSDLLESWHRTVEDLDPTGLGRFDRDERLLRAGILTPRGAVTTAGLLALGVHPQQFVERFIINAAVVTEPGVRATSARTITGPIPVMLDEAVAWARTAFPRHIVGTASGEVRDQWAYPLEAFRELISNTLIHRDLDAWSRGRAIEVRLLSDRLVVTNPGGLHGLTVDRLGQPDATSARNARLVEICRYVRTPTDSRVVELLATGIATVRRTVADAGLPEPQFIDQGLAFTAILPGTPPTTPPARRADLTRAERELLTQLDHPVTVAELVARTGKNAPTLRKTLRALRDDGHIEVRGGRGKTTTYHRTSPPEPGSSEGTAR